MSAKKQLLAQYNLHHTLFNNVLVAIDEEESEVRLVPGINNVKWLAGHLVWGQGGLARMGGVEMDIEWLAHFDTQTKTPAGPELRMPSLEEIKDKWNEIVGPIGEGLEGLSEEAVAVPVEFPMPAFRTVEGLWTFINHHQAYTIGQIGILRRALGKPAMEYF
jgi:hypothetical protein